MFSELETTTGFSLISCIKCFVLYQMCVIYRYFRWIYYIYIYKIGVCHIIMILLFHICIESFVYNVLFQSGLISKKAFLL